MALISKTGINDGGTIQAEHITRIIDALSGVSTDTVVATGSFAGDGSQLTNLPSSSITYVSESGNFSLTEIEVADFDANVYSVLQYRNQYQHLTSAEALILTDLIRC